MMESLSNPKKWSKIAKNLPGRTQHNVKNRFICLLSKEMGINRERIRRSIKEDNFYGLVYRVLEGLRLKKNEEIDEMDEIIKKKKKKKRILTIN